MDTTIFTAAFLVIYLLPTIVGRKKRNAGAIAVVNIFLGWTVVGWVIALAWGCAFEGEHGN